VLQTVLPALLIAGGPSTLVLEGGTHNPWAPPFDFLERVFLPLVNRMGPRVTARLQRPGFYPAGRGRFEVHIEPSATLSGFDLLDRGEITARRARILLSKLPSHIARRELDTIAENLGWSESTFEIDEVDAASPGNVVFVEVESEHVTEVFTAFGRLGVRAEHVAGEAATQARDYLDAGVPVGPYLADQLLLPLGISAWQSDPHPARRGGSFRTRPLTLHSTTHIDVLRAFLGIEITVEPAGDGATCIVHVRPPAE
jgi:RNA 3'-terminal phosphate cyclase (ATP)